MFKFKKFKVTIQPPDYEYQWERDNGVTLTTEIFTEKQCMEICTEVMKQAAGTPCSFTFNVTDVEVETKEERDARKAAEEAEAEAT